jgi:uncharacterized protein
MVPLLVVALKVPIHNAIATSLIAVIATSSAATFRNLRDGLANVRLGVTLETMTVVGAIAGGAIAGLLPPTALIVLFATVLIVMSLLLFGGTEPPPLVEEPRDRGFLARLHASYVDTQLGREIRYGVRRLPLALGLSGVAGMLSGLLGIGGGIVKVPMLTIWCGVPMKAAAATSSFMIGMTAVASVVVYLGRGEILPVVTAASVLGVITGSPVGLILQGRVHGDALRKGFALVMLLIAAQLIWKVLH